MKAIYTVLWENAEGDICSSVSAFIDPVLAHEHAMAMGGWVEESVQAFLGALDDAHGPPRPVPEGGGKP